MVGRKLLYVLMALITAYIGLMYDGPVPGILLGFEILLFVLSFVVSWVLRQSVSVRFEMADQVVESMERAKVMVVFSNRGWLPVGDTLLEVTVSNCLGGETEVYEMNLKAPARSRVRVPFVFSSSYCGVVRIAFKKLCVFDYLRLFKRTRSVRFACECVVMPKLHEMQLAVTEACRNFDSDSEVYDKNRPGDDPSEIFQIREYRQGDKMSRVHWKMTARLDEIMVKELSRPVSNSVGIYLDLRYRDIEEAQAVFDLCYSLSMALLAKECQHRIFWCKQTEPFQFEEISIRSMEDLTEGIGKLLTTGRRRQELYWNVFRNAYPRLNIHRMIGITGMDPKTDMEEFLVPDQMMKTVLTIDDIQDLIEI